MSVSDPKICVVSAEKARKKSILKSKTKTAEKKLKKYSAPGLPKLPICGHKTKSFKCGTISGNDIYRFYKNFYASPDKIYQDNYIIKHLSVIPVNRRRPRNHTKKNCRQFTIKYYIPLKRNKNLIPVCSKAFHTILRIKPGRVLGVARRYGKTGLMAKENRGGNRKSFAFASRKEAVENFIKKIRPLESHYCRGRIKQRIYLAPKLNIKILWRMYCDESLPGYEVKHGFFRKIFNTRFNIGFGSPRQDVCSDCLQLLEQIKLTTNQLQKQILLTQYRIHKLRAKAFFNLLQDDNPEIEIISFDCQKNLVLPKLPDQSVYYSRQLYFHNFTAVIGNSKTSLTPQNVYAYAWTEDQSAKGSNEICTCLYNCLNSLNMDGKKIVRLVADGCGGQNKNSMLLTMAMKWLYEARFSYPDISELQLIFPVTGHSFLPSDRVFALIEKEIRRQESIVQPQQYIDIISKYAKIHNVGKDFPILDWKTQRQDNLKSSFHFQISKCKRIIMTRSSLNRKILVRGEISYRNDISQGCTIMKKGKNVLDINPNIVEVQHNVKPEKLEDVKKLLYKHYGSDWENNPELSYYKKILSVDVEEVPYDEQIEINNSENYLMEEVLDFV